MGIEQNVDMVYQDASLPRIDLDNLQKHLLQETISAASKNPGHQPVTSPAVVRDRCMRTKRSVRFRIPHHDSRAARPCADHQEDPLTNQDAESFVSSLPSTVPETMDEAMMDENVEAAEIEVETEDREAHAQATQFSNATQPISQTAYDDVIRSRSEQRSSDIEPRDVRVDGTELDEEAEEDLQNSIQEGESNFVDICSSFVAAPDALDSVPINISPTQTQHEFTQFRESQRFKTPATAGKKRDHDGNFIDTPVESRNPFARNGNATPGNVVGLSQAFANTQAASSPLPIVPTSELRSDKPSPEILVERNVKGLPTSSPSRLLSDSWRPSEPSSRYIPVGQSQATRRALASEADDAGHTQESTTDEFDSVSSVVERQRRARERESRARKEFEAASSPSSPTKHDSLQIGKLPRRAASERPATVVRSKSKSRSLPSSPPAIENRDPIENTRSDEADENTSAEVPSRSAFEELPHQATSSGTLRSRKNVTTLVPNTTKRTTRSTARPRRNVQPSPSEHRTRYGRSLEPVSSNPVRVANSQRSRPSTQDVDPEPVMSSAGSVDVIPASPEGHLQSTEPSDLHQKTDDKDLHEHTVEIDIDHRENDTSAAHQPISSVLADNGVSEVDSGTLPQNKQQSSTYTTAVTNQSQDGAASVMEWSSQPVRATPPGRKRKRLGEISQEETFPAASQSSAFDPLEALALDSNADFAKVLASSQDQDPVRSRKRTRLGLSNLAQQAVQEQSTPDVLTNSANIGRQLRSKSVAVNDEDQDTENAAPSSSLSELPSTPNTIKTPPKKPAVTKSIWSPGDSPRPRTAPNAMRAQTHSARVGLREVVASRNGRIVSKTTLRTPKAAPMSLPPIEEASPDPLAINATSPAESMIAPSQNEVIAPQMIFAYFMDTKRTYYPAICQGYSAETQNFTIVWPGYDPEQMAQHSVCSLDLRIGDEVRVDREGWPKIVWKIRGFGRIQLADEGSDLLRDIYGHAACILEPKNPKFDLPEGIDKNDLVPIDNIYLDSNQFSRFKKRSFRYTAAIPQSLAAIPRPSTPQVRISTPSTPSSRSRHSVKDASIQPAIKQGILSNMVFVITTKVEDARADLADIVRNHGGIILKSNFQELVNNNIQLRSNFKDLAFAALLADRHSRTEKYMQALALGIPCLSWKWVDACKKREKLVSWQDYLLPAGESMELDGAIRSRILPSFDMTSTKLSEMIDKRPRFFTDANAIFITGRGKAEVQRKTYLFFVRIMGMAKVEQVVDISAAKLHLVNLEKKGQTWVIVDDKDYKDTTRMVQSVKDDTSGKKKKRQKQDEDNEWECRVVDSKFLVQSLILGRLCETDNEDG